MTAQPPPPDNTRRETIEAVRRREVQAIGAGLSRRDWHATEVAYNQLRDRLDEWLRDTRPTAALASAEHPAREDRDAAGDVGKWLSAALDDPNTCAEMKADIEAWFSAGQPRPAPAPAADTDGLVEQLTRERTEADRRCLQAIVERDAALAQLAARTQPPEIAEAFAARLDAIAENISPNRAVYPAPLLHQIADDLRRLLAASTGSRQVVQWDEEVLAKALHDKMEHLDPSDPLSEWGGLNDYDKQFYRSCIDHLRMYALRAPSPRGDIETFETIAQWCEETFGPITPARTAERANEEMIELLETPERVEEAADVVIVLSRYPGLWDAVQRKMAVNRQRTWSLKGDGTGYHVKPALPASSDGAVS